MCELFFIPPLLQADPKPIVVIESLFIDFNGLHFSIFNCDALSCPTSLSDNAGSQRMLILSWLWEWNYRNTFIPLSVRSNAGAVQSLSSAKEWWTRLSPNQNEAKGSFSTDCRRSRSRSKLNVNFLMLPSMGDASFEVTELNKLWRSWTPNYTLYFLAHSFQT